MLNKNFPSFLLKAVTLSTETVLSSNSFHKSTTLALKNLCPIVPFLFLNNLYLCPRVPLLGANSKNLSHCIDSFPVIISWRNYIRKLEVHLKRINRLLKSESHDANVFTSTSSGCDADLKHWLC